MFEFTITFSLQHNIRREIFRKNFDYIEKHNTEFINGQHSYTLGVNKFADMTHEEFLLERTSSKKKVFSPPRTKPAEIDISSLPEKVDWRDEVTTTLTNYKTSQKKTKYTCRKKVKNTYSIFY